MDLFLSTLPPGPPVPDWAVWQEIARLFGIVVGTAFVSFLAAWKMRGKKDAERPFNPLEHAEQPRLFSRKEAHDVMQLVNAWPGLSERVKRNDERLVALERSDKEQGERLVKLESLQEEAMRRMDARDAAAMTEREEDMAWRGRIEGKLDRLIERGAGGRA